MKTQNRSNFAVWMDFKKRHERVLMIALLFFIVPVTVSFLLGYEMKADVATNVPTVVMDEDESGFTKMFTDYVEENSYFNVKAYVDSYEEVEDMIYRGKAYVGIVIPENFYADMLAGKAPVILAIYDGSTLPVLVSAKTSMTEILMTVKSAYMMNVYEGKQNITPDQVMEYVSPIGNATRILYNPTKSFRGFVLPGMLMGIVQIAISIYGAETAYGTRERRIGLRGHCRKIASGVLLSVTSVFSVMAVQWIVFRLPLRGTLLGFAAVTVLFALDITCLGYTIGLIMPNRLFCSQLASVVVIPTSILGGYIFPVVGMPAPMQRIAHLLPFTYFSDTVRNTCLKPLRLHHLYEEMLFLLIFFLCEALLLALICAVRERRRNSGPESVRKAGCGRHA